MISNQNRCSNEVITEVNIVKRKSPENESLSTPPSKLARTEGESPDQEERLKSACPDEFNSYQYWKDPLPNISDELLRLPSCMLCD